MREETLVVLGIPLKFQYHLYENAHVAWNLHPNYKGPSPLLEILLRIHYESYIVSMLRESWFQQVYEESQFDPSQQDKLF